MNDSFFTRVPLAGVFIPFAAGILLNSLCHSWVIPIFIGVAAIGVWLLLSHRGKEPLKRLKYRPYWFVLLAMMALSVGMLAERSRHDAPLPVEAINGKSVCARIDDLRYKDFSMRIEAELLLSDSARSFSKNRVLINTRGCDYLLRAGDVIVFEGDFSPVAGLGNPDEFDRVSYLARHDIHYTQMLEAEKLKVIGHHKTLLTEAKTANRHLVRRIRGTNLPADKQDIIIALLLGNDNYLDSEVREVFGNAGVAHVLALSGLHVGIIGTIIWLLLFPLDYVRMKKVRLVVSLLAIICYAVLTGLSPSVVRATVMMGMVIIAHVFYRRNSAMNALFLAGLILLVASPGTIFNAGFQLSFITVGSIIGLQDYLPQVSRRNRLAYSLTSGLYASAIAMLSTIGLTAYYFGTVAWFSVVSNLLILPIFPVLMVFGALFIFLAACGLDWSVVDAIIEWLCDAISTIVNWVGSLPFSHVSGIYVNGWMVAIYFALFAAVVALIVRRNNVYLLVAAALVAVMVSISAIQTARTPLRGIFILNDYRSTPILCFENHQGYLWIPDREHCDTQAFELNHRRLLAHYRIDRLKAVEGRLDTAGVMFNPPGAMLAGERLMTFVRDGAGSVPGVSGTPIDLDVAVICRGFSDSIADVTRNFAVRHIVVTGALNESRLQKIQSECKRDKRLHFIGIDGAWVHFGE